jgi:D-inositol-3-phosphate glycosyltransferase
VRRWDDDLPETVAVEPGVQVVHVPAGPARLAKEKLPSIVDEFTDRLQTRLAERPVDVLHANYWLSGEVGHRLKHTFDLPLVSTFHTLARVKASTGDAEPQRRVDAESRVVQCSDVLTASGAAEAAQLVELYQADPTRIEIVPPGVDHAFFSPGSRPGARRALGLAEGIPVLLFVGRIQPLKGLGVAIDALAELKVRHPGAVLLVVGGPSGSAGEREKARCRASAEAQGVGGAIRWVDPQPHHVLSTYYRAADVVVMPSRSESFGMVALEAAACGIPVVGAAVGGLRSIVVDGSTGRLIDGRDPSDYAAAIDELLNDPAFAAAVGDRAAARARGYTWPMVAARLRRVYADLTQRVPVPCR